MRKAPLLGYETPRIFTPPLRELTPQTSHGFAAVRFAEDVLGLKLMPWQKWILIHALELRPDGLYRFRTVVLLVARQNGKTMLMLILALWHIYARGSRTVIGTAQDLVNAEKAWAEAVAMAESEPELAELIANIVQQTGKKALVLEDGEQYRVAAASRRGARGFSGDLVLLDELREHQSWDSWAASTKTTLARPKAQVWCFSNAGDFLSIVLRYLRASAHQELGWPDGDGDKDVLDQGDSADFDEWEDELDQESIGFFEYSAPPSAARNDREGWAQANPSMNHTDIVEDVITDRAIAAAMKTDPKPVFEVEVLCRWLSSLDGGPYPTGAWAAGTDNESAIAEGSKIAACVDVSWDRTMAHIAFCGYRQDGDRHVEIVASRAGTEWVKPWLVERRDAISVVALQAKGAPVSSLYDELTAPNPDTEKPDLVVVAWEGAELGKAGGQFYDKVARQDGADKKLFLPSIWHTKQPVLDVAANTAVVKQAGDAWMIDRRRSPLDSSPLIAANGADWALDQIPPDQPTSAYAEDDWDLVVL